MTPNWETLLDESALAALLPVEYARFARPVRDALALFLSGLPQADQLAVMIAQAGLPHDASFSQRLGVLARKSPVLQKLGQILARDRRLAPELREQLRELESLTPTVPLRTIERELERELGPLDRRGLTLLPPAVAEASVAVVIPYRRAGSDREGVFKLLKPGIEERLERELQLLEQVGESLDQRCEELQIPHLDYQESFQQVRGKLWEEVQLEHEQRHLQEAAVFFADEPRVQIPRLFEHCTPRVTAMERVTGGKVTDPRSECRCGRRRLAALVARALIAKPIFSRRPQALFHSDPHAGNLFETTDGRLAILDWSLVGRLCEPERLAVLQVLLGAVTLDGGRIVSVLRSLADPRRLDPPALRDVVERWVKRVRRGQFPGLAWLTGLLDDTTQRARLRVGADLMLFRKSLHTLDGVVGEVGGGSGQIDQVLQLEFLRHFMLEWPQRWFSLPTSRAFATRLSNLDLTRTMLSGPVTAARFWTGHTVDLIETCARAVRHDSPLAARQEPPCPSSA